MVANAVFDLIRKFIKNQILKKKEVINNKIYLLASSSISKGDWNITRWPENSSYEIL